MDQGDATELLEFIGYQGNPLARIERARWVMRTAEDDMHAAIREARQEGASWAAIGDAIDMTRQAAHERFRDLA